MSVGEYQAAGVQCHRPPPGRVSEMLATEIDRLGGHLIEVLDDDTSAFSVGARINPDAPVHRQLRLVSLSRRTEGGI